LLTLVLQGLLAALHSHSLGTFGLGFAVSLLSAILLDPAPLTLSAFLHLPLSWPCLRLVCYFLSDKIFNPYQHNHCYNAQCNDLLKHFLFPSELWPLFIPPHHILMFSGGF